MGYAALAAASSRAASHARRPPVGEGRGCIWMWWPPGKWKAEAPLEGLLDTASLAEVSEELKSSRYAALCCERSAQYVH